MNLVSRLLVVALASIWFVPIAHAAQPNVTVSWSAPTLATDGSSLTGAQAITKYEVFIATASIPDNVTGTPTATVTSGTTTTQPITASPGATIFARVRACNAAGCSVLTTEASKVLPLNSPIPPTNVTITLNVQ